MILVIDAGNTNTVLGLFDGNRLKKTWRVESTPKALLKLSKKLPPVDGVSLSSVVPSLNKTFASLSQKVSKKKPFEISTKLRMPIRIGLKNKKEVGADRIVNAAAAYHRWKQALIIVDFGTATTFDVVTQQGVYIGGAISPGLGTANRALFEKCAKLPLAPLKKPGRAIGNNTVSAIQSGVLYGYAGLVEGMVKRLSKEMKTTPKVIATGGLSPLIATLTSCLEKVDTDLTLTGLRLLYHWNTFTKRK